jgi:predicted CXXCH cytochrome family protein
MNKVLKRRFLLLGLLIVISISAIAAYTISKEPHKFSERECRNCHLAPYKNPKWLIASVTRLCKKCHRKTIRASSHPVDVEPKLARIPADLPLKNGKITCNTCHNIHSESRLVFGIKSYFLRRPTTDMKFFCIACHEEDRQKPGHKELITLAHIGSKYRVTDPTQPLDPLSVQCIGCHDGTIGSPVNYSLGGGIWAHIDDAHPIGVHYNTARMRRGGLAPISMLDRRIRFFAGRIGCGTCHDMYSTLPAKLVMENDDSKLCRTCHYDK